MFPPWLQDWLAEGSLGRLVAEVVEALDLVVIYAKYEEGMGGRSAYDPRMMVLVLIYGYCWGVASSRRIERARYEDVAFRYWAADQHRDHDTIAAFRQEPLAPWAQGFVQVLPLCPRGGTGEAGARGAGGDEDQGQRLRCKRRRTRVISVSPTSPMRSGRRSICTQSAETLPLRMESPECLKELAQPIQFLFAAADPVGKAQNPDRGDRVSAKIGMWGFISHGLLAMQHNLTY